MSEVANLPARRMGPEGSATWNLLLDGAEAIVREEGYGALSSRRVAARVGVKQQLVYYYFRTMDDLVVEAMRRSSLRELERMRAALDSPQPLRTMWDICIHTEDARFILEFMALANRSEGVRREVVRFIEESRALQVEAVRRAMAARGMGPVSPLAATLLATSVALALNREAAIGVTTGHAEIEKLADELLASLEPQARP
jgi:AcrR family transcriptional regulator